MTRHEWILQKVLRGASDGNVGFDELCDLLRRLGFDDRHRGGSHRIFSRAGIVEIVNLQPRAGGRAKAYQVSDAHAAFVVEVPELHGCMADGSTYAEAVAAAEIVIAEWIATARELGRLIPEPRGRLPFA